MKISENGLALIKRFEGCSLKAYQDCVGVWTIGWGITNADRAITGTTIKRGLTISKSTAEDWLRKSINQKYAPLVDKYNETYCWSQNEFDALVSFAYNIGNIDQLTDNGKRSRAEICAAWCKYDKAGGKHNKGLLERRQAELALFRKYSPETPAGNPYPEPIVTVCSNETAAALKLQKWVPRGEMVKWVQWHLVRLGYQIGTVDGIFGAKTTSAVTEFQSGAGLTVDKAVGPVTRAALKAAKEKPKAASSTTAEENKSSGYLASVASKAKEIYPLCIGKTHGSAVQKKVKNLAQFKKQKRLNCHLMVSLVLQEAGCLPKGCFILHTTKRNGKKTIADAVKGIGKLRHCKVVWVNKYYRDLPEKYKRAGVVYIQNSNACISAGGGKFWSCNGHVGTLYRRKSDYLRREGYPLSSKILVVIVPD